MDFVVVGLGLGTLAILAGVLLFAWVAGRWERAAARATTPEDAAHDKAAAVGRRGAGQAFIGAGVAVLIATIAALAGSLDDQTGAFFVTTTATVAALGLLVWAYLYRTRNPLPPRRRARTEDEGRRTEVRERERASGAAGPSAVEMPLEDEPAEDDEAGDEDVPSIAQIPAATSDHEPELDTEEEDEDVDTTNEAPVQRDPAMNGADHAPLSAHEYEDDGKGRRDRQT